MAFSFTPGVERDRLTGLLYSESYVKPRVAKPARVYAAILRKVLWA